MCNLLTQVVIILCHSFPLPSLHLKSHSSPAGNYFLPQLPSPQVASYTLLSPLLVLLSARTPSILHVFFMNLLSSFSVLSPSMSRSYIFTVLSPTPKPLPLSLPPATILFHALPCLPPSASFSPIFFAMQNQTSFHVASLPCSSLSQRLLSQ